MRVGFHVLLVCSAILVIGLMGGCCCGIEEALAKERPLLPTHVPCSSDRKIMAMQKRLNRHGVRVITMGQDYLISIPSRILFANESPRLTWQSYRVLNEVACYLKAFRKVAVNVSGYSSKCFSAQREHALTLARTREVGNYLWSQGIESRFIFTQGMGSDKPIFGARLGGDQSPNSRIEITFRNTVA